MQYKLVEVPDCTRAVLLVWSSSGLCRVVLFVLSTIRDGSTKVYTDSSGIH